MAVTTTSLPVKDGSGNAASFGTLTDPATLQRSIVSLDTAGVAAYRVSANFTPQPTAAVTIITVTGSATKTVRVKRIAISGVSTALSASVFQLQRTSALGAGGTLVAPTVGKLDSGTVAAATAVVNHWTTTLKATGTAVGGPLSMWQQNTSTVTTPTVAVLPTQTVFPENGQAGSAIVLRGVADILEVQNVTPTNLGAGTVLAYVVEWEEDGS